MVLRILGIKPKKQGVRVVQSVKHSRKPALSYAKHGTVLLKGKIEEYSAAKAE